MNIEEIRESYPEVALMDGYDDCIVGVICGAGIQSKVCYSTEKVICKLMDDGMMYDDALEYHDFNQVGAYVGEHTPCFLQDL